MARIGFSVLILLMVLGCSDADTLGDDPPVEVIVQGALTYENGINSMLLLKCGYCHAWPLPPTAPDNVVDDLDLTTFATRIENGRVIRGADSIGSWINEGILDGPVPVFDSTSNPRQMPLDYGTPLTEREKIDLFDWSALGSPLNENPDPEGDPEAGAAFYLGVCATCHGNDGQGVQFRDVWIGPPIRPATATTAKLKSMWLHKAYSENFQVMLTDEDAADLRAYILAEVLNTDRNP